MPLDRTGRERRRRAFPGSFRGVLVALLLVLVAMFPHPVGALDKASLDKRMAELWKQQRYRQVIPLAHRLFRLTKDPRMLVNIAISHDKLGETEQAIRFYDRFLSQSPQGVTTNGKQSRLKAHVRQRVSLLRLRYAKVKREIMLRSTPRDVSVWIDGKRIADRTPTRFWLSFGNHVFALRANGFEPFRSQLLIQEGPLYTLSFTLVRRRSVTRVATGVLVVASPVGARVEVDGRFVGHVPLRLPLPIGPHRVRIVGRRGSWERQVLIAPGTPQRVVVPIFRPGTPKAISRARIAAWSTLGVGCAVLVAGAVVHLTAIRLKDDANGFIKHQQSINQVTESALSEYQRRFGKAQTRLKVAIGLYTVGGVALVASTVLFFIKPRRSRESVDRVQWAPSIAPNYVGIRGHF